MAHFNQRDVREQRTNRKRAILAVFLLIPLALAIYFFVTISNRTLNAETVNQILIGEDAKSYFRTLTEREDIALCMNAIDRATKITDSSRPLDKYRVFYLTCSDEYTRRTWNVYFSDDVNDALLLNDENKLYALTPEDAKALMVSSFFENVLYKTAPSYLDLKIGEEAHSVAPSYSDWHYRVAGGETRVTSAEAEKGAFTATVVPVFSVPDGPDHIKLTISNGTDVWETEKLSEFESMLPAEGGELDVTVSVTWSDYETDAFEGKAIYRFSLNYTPVKG